MLAVIVQLSGGFTHNSTQRFFQNHASKQSSCRCCCCCYWLIPLAPKLHYFRRQLCCLRALVHCCCCCCCCPGSKNSTWRHRSGIIRSDNREKNADHEKTEKAKQKTQPILIVTSSVGKWSSDEIVTRHPISLKVRFAENFRSILKIIEEPMLAWFKHSRQIGQNMNLSFPAASLMSFAGYCKSGYCR